MMFRLDLQYFASKKGVGSTKNGRDSESKRLGAKLADGNTVMQVALSTSKRYQDHPGTNVGIGGDTLFALVRDKSNMKDL